MERKQFIVQTPVVDAVSREDDGAGRLAHRTKMWILAGVLLSAFVAALDSTVVGTAMPRIIGDLAGMQYYAWPFTAYIVCMATAIPIFGRMADIVGFKHVYLVGMLCFLAGSALCGASQSMMQLIIFRGVQGIGGGIMTANSLGIIGATFAPAERAKYTGAGSAVMALASIIGPSLGGYITDNFGWRWVFYVNIPVGLFALAVIMSTLPVVRRRPARGIDWPGIVVFIAATVPLLLALMWAGDEYGWRSAQTVGLFAMSFAMLAFFITVEMKAPPTRIVPMSYFREGIFDVCSLGMLLYSGISIGMVMFVPLFVQGVIGATATNSGMIMTPMMLGLVVAAASVVGSSARTLRYKPLALAGLALMAVGMILLTRIGVDTSRRRRSRI